MGKEVSTISKPPLHSSSKPPLHSSSKQPLSARGGVTKARAPAKASPAPSTLSSPFCVVKPFGHKQLFSDINKRMSEISKTKTTGSGHL